MNPYSVNLLEYLRSKTQVDLDSFDITGKMTVILIYKQS